MSEYALWVLVRKTLAPFGRLNRIENRCDKGTPDVAYTLRGVMGWCELKYAPGWPMDRTTPLNLTELKLEQVLWMEDEARAGGRVCMLTQIGITYLVTDAAITRCIYQRLLTYDQIVALFPQRILARLDRKWILDWLTK